MVLTAFKLSRGPTLGASLSLEHPFQQYCAVHVLTTLNQVVLTFTRPWLAT